jgi:hypothetical protein
MGDTLLFLHLLAAAALFGTVVMFTAYVLGGPVERRGLAIAGALGTVGGLGTIIFGIWLAIYLDGYEIWDGWIIASVVLWAAAFATSHPRESVLKASVGDEPKSIPVTGRAAQTHWLNVILLIALLAVMIWKPGA